MSSSRVQLTTGRWRRGTAVVGILLAAFALAWGGPVARFLAPIAIVAFYLAIIRWMTWPEYVVILAIILVLASLLTSAIPPPTTGRHRPRAPAAATIPAPRPVDGR